MEFPVRPRSSPSRRLPSLYACCNHRYIAVLFAVTLFLHWPGDVSAFKDITVISFDKGFKPLFGDGNLVRTNDGNARILLDRFTGAGFITSDMYQHGFFSANIKLPSAYTAGVVVAFYMSNGDVFLKTHDELDIEFLGNVMGKPWRFQTNVYGNGSVHRGREERYTLWFDPSKDFHRYSILWTATTVIFYVDEVPIREVVRSEDMGGEFPSKPMSLYATIWDASDWATGGGKYKVNYKFAPFVAEFQEFVLDGCQADPIQEVQSDSCDEKEAEVESKDFSVLTDKQRRSMRWFRESYMYYSYCYDSMRYPIAPPECVIIPSEQERFNMTGRLKFGGSHKRRRLQQRRRSPLKK
ncbi:hypothetical protein MLD38_019745 [Melastoma candidum]|uniref:Uncharacterized protein n=1 Tax=Melastoma candidum TaxID=119954 RepID=A0ACB9QX51_9MYRT|nr:hypothetical protein MLD38_019745 [Melastoma candidum]